VKSKKRPLWRELIQPPTLVYVITVLVSAILAVFQFSGVIKLRPNQTLYLILSLLVLISGSLFGERIGILRQLQEKQESLEKLITQKKQTRTDTEVLR
jgi:hypothetical protein